MTRAAFRVLALGLFGIGIWLTGEGIWIQAKAGLAQALIGNAWRNAADADSVPRPWPWADMAPVAILEAPLHRIRQVVLSGATGRTLAFGPAHMSASAEIGSDGVVVLVGHRDTHFAFLEDVRPGDGFVLTDRRGGRWPYRVVATEIADSRSDRLRLDPEGRQLVLLTCYPFDAVDPGGPLRYVVTAVAVDDAARSSGHPARYPVRGAPMPSPPAADAHP